MAKFELHAKDYGIMIDVSCQDNGDGYYPNQGDLREALNKLFMALSSWETVDIEIKSIPE